MTVSDVTILGKKILVGIIVTLVPFIIIFGGLWLTRKLLTEHEATKRPIVKQIKTNRI
ncbi:MAG: hypothetical protein ACXVJD_11305 [Mucilaginibacter sp.]